MVGTGPDSVVGSGAQKGCHSFWLACSHIVAFVRAVIAMPVSLLLIYVLFLPFANAIAAAAARHPQSPAPPRSMMSSPSGPAVRTGRSALLLLVVVSEVVAAVFCFFSSVC